ncbi:MAG: nuclear transport factor 2 family protein, partial [Sphingobacteriales bacterium]
MITALRHINELVISGKMMEAFEKYYHDEVIMQENDMPATIGKAANR